ncbi:MAG: hypothetical protein HP495_04615 [Nitrospira sp.]|nr:hypothetical protein [Nitrospira sp.]
MTTSIFGIDDCVKKEGNEVGKMIGVEMREQEMRDLVPVDASLDQIHQGARAEIQNKVLISAHEITSCGTRGMNVGPGTKDS